MSDTALTKDIPLTKICGMRDDAVAKMSEAVDLLRRGHALAAEAQAVAETAAGGAVYGLRDRRDDAAFRRLFEDFNAEASALTFRHNTDACIWLHLLKVTGMEHLMDATARQEFFDALASDDGVPEVNEDNVVATLEGFRGDAGLIFQRGLARAFAALDRRFKSHDAFKLGARAVLTNVFDEWGSWNYYSKARGTIQDIERVLAVLDGQAPQPGELEATINEARGSGWGRRQGECETRYLRIRTFKNGNAHLWFTRDDLVEKANLVLAEYYGEVLPDASPMEDETPLQRSGVPAKNLSFYPTPAAVGRRLVNDLGLSPDARVLEPSAGTGDLVTLLLGLGFRVDAVEIDHDRVRALSQIRVPPLSKLVVRWGNFLRLSPTPTYDAVVMNPPFYGTHWMQHVIHAFDFLKPGGVLRAVLPATAEVSESPQHERFRAWAEKRSPYGRLRFTELPPESFAASGTRINTVILELRKEAHHG